MSAKIKTTPHQTGLRHKHKPKGVSGHNFEKVYWPYIPILIFAFVLFGMAAHNGLLKTMLKHPTKSVLSYATNLSQEELLKDTNNARAANGQKALSANAQLIQAAQAKANDMALRNYWSHNTPAGNPPWVFVTAAGYQYDKIGENLAAGFTSAQAAINGWMASPEHRDNMLDSEYTQVGFGFANNPDYTSTGNNGPMTVVVAFYGEPVQPTTALDKDTAITLAAASGNLTKSPPTTTSRAQVALAAWPIAAYGGAAVGFGIFAVILVWSGRHFWAVRKAIKRGERFVISHPLFDLGLLLAGFIFYALTKTAGFIQ